MKPHFLLLGAAALASAACQNAEAYPGKFASAAGAGEACWIEADTGRNITALKAYSAPGLQGHWTLEVRHRDGVSYHSEQSGALKASNGPDLLSRLVISQNFAPPPRRNFRASLPVPAGGGTVISGSGYRPAPGEVLPVEAELNLYAPDGALICRARDIWLREGI